MEENEGTTEEGSSGLIEVKISDVFGLAKSASELRKVSENIQKSLERGIGKLSEPVTTILQAKADAKALTIRGNAQLELINKKIELYTNLVSTIESSGGSAELVQLVHRLYNREVLDRLEEQEIREKVGYYLVEELQNLDRKEIWIKDIDSDWLTLFWSTVEKKSSEDIQRIYARILAGECLRPGSHSSRLLHILSIMTQKDAQAFELICNMSIQDEGGVFLIEPIEEFDNFLEAEIVSHEDFGDFVIEDLESLGLLARAKMVAFHEDEHGTKKNIGGIACTLNIVDSELLNENMHYITGIPFTKPAEELRSIISLEQNKAYFAALSKFALEHLGVELVETN